MWCYLNLASTIAVDFLRLKSTNENTETKYSGLQQPAIRVILLYKYQNFFFLIRTEKSLGEKQRLPNVVLKKKYKKSTQWLLFPRVKISFDLAWRSVITSKEKMINNCEPPSFPVSHLVLLFFLFFFSSYFFSVQLQRPCLVVAACLPAAQLSASSSSSSSSYSASASHVSHWFTCNTQRSALVLSTCDCRFILAETLSLSPFWNNQSSNDQ